ncbi:MAG: LON peptidase substrate-binding domain-containing protein [Acidimicrobiales bacterium]
MAVLPMFPLGTVLLPSGVLPLHVFEPRYRRLAEDCLGGVPEFGVVLIERGSEVGGGDQRTQIGTVARIVEAATFDDGRYALGTVGVRRIRVVRWLEDDPYPRAEVEDWDDPEPPPDLDERVAEATAHLRRVLATAAELGADVAPASFELGDDPVLATYQLVALSPLGPHDRQALLAAPSAQERLGALVSLLEEELAFLHQRLQLDADDGGLLDGPDDPDQPGDPGR